MPQLRWEGGKGAKLRGKVNAESSSEAVSGYKTLTITGCVVGCGRHECSFGKCQPVALPDRLQGGQLCQLQIGLTLAGLTLEVSFSLADPP